MATNKEILKRMGYDTNNLIVDIKKKGEITEKKVKERVLQNEAKKPEKAKSIGRERL